MKYFPQDPIEYEKIEPKKQLCWYSLAWVVFIKLISKNVFNFENRVECSRFMDKVIGPGRGKHTTISVMNIMRSRKAFCITKIIDDKPYVISLLRIKDPDKYNPYSTMFLQFGNECSGFDGQSFVYDIVVNKKDYYDFLKENSFEAFMNKNISDEAKKYFDIKKEKENTLVKDAITIYNSIMDELEKEV